ncbi:MAG: hypothetical protein EXR78_06985 [Deltaproteobacteria bacterium]|nr:hypothetical protein [Deltaproteobacteria bacterium]
MMVVVILLCIFYCPVTATAQINPEPPPLVRFTGSFLPLSETKPLGLSTLTVSIKETKWRFHITKVEKLTGRDPSGTRLLESLFPRHLRFIGPDHLLNVLRDPQIEGTVMTIEGHLYVGERMFLLTISPYAPGAKKV